MIHRFTILVLFLVCAPLNYADSKKPTQPYYMFWGFYGQSWFFFGSEDFRTGGGFGIQYAKPEPKFRFKRKQAQLVWELYTLHTAGGNKFQFPPDCTNALGFLAHARYEVRPKKGIGSYLDLGFGVQAASQSTLDLPSRVNTTPTIAGGLIFPLGSGDIYLGFRLMHISNAGTKGNNPGQNQIRLAIGYRF